MPEKLPKIGPKIERTATAAEVMRFINNWWAMKQNGWDLKQMTAEEVSDAVSDKIAEMSTEVGYRNPNPDNDDTEQDY